LSASGPIAVICAMEFEMAHLRRAVLDQSWPLELVVSGMGMAPAASATREAIERCAPRAVLNYGCAGAHRADLAIGDIVVGTDAVAYLDADTPVAHCDADLLETARQVAAEHPRVVFGTVASADAWNRSPEGIGALAARHASLCEDMEAAAIGLACAAHGVPFLTIKDISNNELVRQTLSGEAMLREIGLDQIARRAAEFTWQVLNETLELATR
jgi:adenosylhomocysteine nucleosidase